jgi:hypothetical protein
MGRGLKAFLAGGVFLYAAGASAETPPAPSPSLLCEPRRSQDRFEALTGPGEIRLASGGVARLAGIRFPVEEKEKQAGADWLRSFQGAVIRISALAGEPDRWGRLPAAVAAEHEAGPIDLGRGLVAAGLALVDAGEAERLCEPALLAAEARAREWGLGVWRAGGYKPIAAGDLETLRGRVGQFALVEGRVRSVGERAQRTYLNFGADWASDFTVTLPKRTWQRMREQGVSAAGLRGRRVRVRGIVEEWRGPEITINSPEMVEILDSDRSPSR